MNIRSRKTTHEFAPDDIRDLIAGSLGKDKSKVSVRFVITEVGGDIFDRYPGRPTVTSIEVTVDET